MITIQLCTIIRIIELILRGEDHRFVVYEYIDDIFVSQTLEIFRKIVDAKSHDQKIDENWYSRNFLNEQLEKNEIAWNSGFSLKSVANRFGSMKKSIVLDRAQKHHQQFSELVDSYAKDELNVSLQISTERTPVVLDFNETFFVINAIAVRRAGTRGGAWSSLGKQVEGPLMTVLCMLHEVDGKYYTRTSIGDGHSREVDFYLITPAGEENRCEVKLMGKGNPEGADVVVARESKVFVASNLSKMNKQQLNDLGVLWVELQQQNGFTKFGEVLTDLEIPHTDLKKNVNHSSRIEDAISNFLSESNLAS